MLHFSLPNTCSSVNALLVTHLHLSFSPLQWSLLVLAQILLQGWDTSPTVAVISNVSQTHACLSSTFMVNFSCLGMQYIYLFEKLIAISFFLHSFCFLQIFFLLLSLLLSCHLGLFDSSKILQDFGDLDRPLNFKSEDIKSCLVSSCAWARYSDRGRSPGSGRDVFRKIKGRKCIKHSICLNILRGSWHNWLKGWG